MVLTNQTPEKDVEQMFTRVAPKYDLMNNLVSLGVQKKWRRIFLEELNLKKTDKCVDLCCGTADTTIALAKVSDKVVGIDFNETMLKLAAEKINAQDVANKVKLLKADAMNLPIRSNSCDIVTICFGLRNVPDAGRTIREAYRVLKPGGKFAILEMSQPTNCVIKLAWNAYFKLFPYLAKLTNAQVSDYQYLSRTTKAFLSAAQLKSLLEQKGFKDVFVTRLTFGSGAIHLAIK